MSSPVKKRIVRRRPGSSAVWLSLRLARRNVNARLPAPQWVAMLEAAGNGLFDIEPFYKKRDQRTNLIQLKYHWVLKTIISGEHRWRQFLKVEP
jgi:hypothetical protein